MPPGEQLMPPESEGQTSQPSTQAKQSQNSSACYEEGIGLHPPQWLHQEIEPEGRQRTGVCAHVRVTHQQEGALWVVEGLH